MRVMLIKMLMLLTRGVIKSEMGGINEDGMYDR
jgi:hypothetical protein